MADMTKCNLFIPHKDYLSHLRFDSEGNITPDSLKTVAAMEFDNWKRVEEWANYIGPLICDCECSEAVPDPGGGGGGGV